MNFPSARVHCTHTHTHTHTQSSHGVKSAKFAQLAQRLFLFCLGAVFHLSAICQPATITVTCEQRDCGGLCYTFSTDLEGPHAWTFGDGESLPSAYFQATVQHCYTNVNTYLGINTMPVVTVTNLNGGSASTQLNHGMCQQGVYIGKVDGAVSNLNTYTALPGSTFNGLGNTRKVHVYGTVNVNKNFTFDAANVFMWPGVGFNVLRSTSPIGVGYIFKLINTTKIRTMDNCDCLWRGIVVHGKLEVLSGSTLQDALYAVQPVQMPIGTTPSLKIREANFTSNYIGLMGASGGFSFDGNFERNTFSTANNEVKNWCSATVTNPFAPSIGQFSDATGFAGIYLNGIGSFRIPPTTLVNSFEKLANGIFMVNTNAVGKQSPPGVFGVGIQSCKFKEILRNGYTAAVGGHGIYFLDTQGNHRMEQVGLGQTQANNPTFDMCEVGVYAEATNGVAGGVVNSRENFMGSVETGYRFECLTGNLNGTINRNEIHSTVNYEHFPGNIKSAIWVEDRNEDFSTYTIDDNNVTLNQPGNDFGFAIFVRGDFNTNPTVNNVSITNNDDVVVQLGSAGIYSINYSGIVAQGNTVICQQYNLSTLIGIGFVGGVGNSAIFNDIQGPFADGLIANRHGIRTNGSEDVVIQDNTIFQFENGVTFQEPCGTNATFRCNHLQGEQTYGLFYDAEATTGPQFDQGNTWEGTYNIQAAENQNPMFLDDLYRARNNPALAPGEWPPSISPATWFDDNTNVNPMCPIPGAANLNGSDSTIAEGGMIGEDGTIWSLERYLYGKLKENPNFLSGNSLMQSFVNARETASMGQLYEIGKGIQLLFEIPATTQTTLDANAASIQAQINQIVAIDSLLATSPSNEGTLLEQRQQHSDTIVTLHAANASIYASLQQNKITEADDLLAENSAISTGTAVENNEKQFFNVYLQTIAKDNANATTAQLQTLKSIANQCPEEGGRAVYWAIGLYGNLTDTLLIVQDCGLGFRTGKINEEKAVLSGNHFSVSPNPSSGDCRISCQLATGQEAKLVVFDLTGVKVSEHPLVSDMENMSLSGVLPGVYLLHLMVQGKTVQVEKFIKL